MHRLVLFSVVIALSCADPEKEQPIAYSHNVHIETVELVCADCHVSVESGIKATIPSMDVCESCHTDEPMSDSPEEAKLLEYVSSGTQVPWQKVYAVPDHVYFSHRRHVTAGEIECIECHGDVASFTAPISRPFIPVRMENCMDCHRARNVSNDCLSCHR